MADDDHNTDYSFLPESFKKDDGYDTDGFKAHYDELSSFKSQADEKAAAMPKEAADYLFKAPDEFQWPEGFDATQHQMPVLDDEGKPVMDGDNVKTRDMDVSDIVNPNDPDIPVLQEALLKHGAEQGLMDDLFGILAQREIRSLMQAAENAGEEMKALGPDGQSRVDVVKRSLAAKLPQAQADALASTISSADSLRAVEALLKTSSVPPAPKPGNKPDLDSMSNDDLILMGMQQNMKG